MGVMTVAEMATTRHRVSGQKPGNSYPVSRFVMSLHQLVVENQSMRYDLADESAGHI